MKQNTMKSPSTPPRSHLIVLAFVLGLCMQQTPAADLAAPGEELRTADQVRRLTPEQAARKMPVHIRGVMSFFDENLYSRFVQDETAGIYLQATNLPPVTAGQMIEVEGVTGPGEYAPIIVVTQIKVLGEGKLPAAKPVDVEQLVSGHEDSQFVEIVSIVRAVRFEEESKYYLIEVVTGGERFTIYTKQLPVSQAEELVDSVVRARGVCSTLFNRQRQLFGFRLLVPRPTDLVIEKPASANPFAIPTQTIESLLRFTPQGTYGHRVKVAGTVSYQEPGRALFIEDGKSGLYIQTRQRTPVQPGDRVEVLGFSAKGEYTPLVQDALYRKVGGGTPPQPVQVDLDETLKGTYDCRLVRLDANLLDRTQRGREQFLVLESGGFIFHGYLGQNESGLGFAHAQNGSEVAVTGVCLIERGSGWLAGEGWRAKSFRLLLRSPSDVTVLQAPPWWTQASRLRMVGILSVLVLILLVGIDILRRRGQKPA